MRSNRLVIFQILDDFDREDGEVGEYWSANAWGYDVENGQLITNPGATYWRSSAFGANQEAYVTILGVDAYYFGVVLRLKAQDPDATTSASISVYFRATYGDIQVEVTDGNGNSQVLGNTQSVDFEPGVRFGARAYADGKIEVYQNDTLVMTRYATGWTYNSSGGYIGIAAMGGSILDNFGGGTIDPMSTFPAAGILDGFNRPDGPINNYWLGWTDNYEIDAHQLVAEGGSPLFWAAEEFEEDQEVSLELSDVGDWGEVQLFLKSQASDTWEGGLLAVTYHVEQGSVTVSSYDPWQGDVQWGGAIPASFADGDRFRAVARAGGDVEIYQNSALLGIRDASGWPSIGNEGFIGMAVDGLTVDDFGGGNLGEAAAVEDGHPPVVRLWTQFVEKVKGIFEPQPVFAAAEPGKLKAPKPEGTRAWLRRGMASIPPSPPIDRV